MKVSHIVLLAIGLIAVSLIGSAISYYNYGVRTEAGIVAAWENNENILGQYSLKVIEAAKVPDKYTEDLRTVYREAMTGRYGDDGSGAVMQWIQEQNPQLSPELRRVLFRSIFRISLKQVVPSSKMLKLNLLIVSVHTKSNLIVYGVGLC